MLFLLTVYTQDRSPSRLKFARVAQVTWSRRSGAKLPETVKAVRSRGRSSEVVDRADREDRGSFEDVSREDPANLLPIVRPPGQQLPLQALLPV